MCRPAHRASSYSIVLTLPLITQDPRQSFSSRGASNVPAQAASASPAACKRVVALMLPRLLALLPAAHSPASSWLGSSQALYTFTVATAILKAAAAVAATTGELAAAASSASQANNSLSLQRNGAHDSGSQSSASAAAPSSAAPPSSSPVPQQVVGSLLEGLRAAHAALSHTSSSPDAMDVDGTSGADAPAVDATAMDTDVQDAGGSGSADLAPEMQIACTQLWQQLLSLHTHVGHAVLPPGQVQACVRVLWGWALAKGLPSSSPAVSSVVSRMQWGSDVVPADVARAVVVGLLRPGLGPTYDIARDIVLQELGTALQLVAPTRSAPEADDSCAAAPSTCIQLVDGSSWQRALDCAAAAGHASGEVAAVLLQQMAPVTLSGMQAVEVPQLQLQVLGACLT